MDNDAAREALAQADLLANRTASQGRWLVRYYLILGVASLLVGAAFGLFHGPVAMVTLVTIWMAVVVGISIYANTRRAVVRGMGRLHMTVMLGWSAAWILTVGFGTGRNLGWQWYLFGGVLMLAVCLAGAYVAYRRTAGVAT